MAIRNQKGQSLVEYTLIFSLIAIVIIVVATNLGLQITCNLASIASSIEHVISPTTRVANDYIAAKCAVLGPPFDAI
jgi:Flp pilus assembly pilin Flp